MVSHRARPGRMFMIGKIHGSRICSSKRQAGHLSFVLSPDYPVPIAQDIDQLHL